MGNKVASEGEDMADSPKAGVGEIVPNKKKHRSFRRRLADKFRKSKHKKEYQEDKEQIVLQKNSSQPQPKTLNTRKNYYKNLGISQLSNGDRVNYSPYHRAITSTISELSPRAHTRTGKEHVTSYSHIALAKAKSRAENDRKKVSCDSPSKGGFSDFLPSKEETKISIPSKLDYRENDVEELKNGRNTTPDSRKSLEDLLDKDKDDSTTADTFSINDTDKEEQDFKLDFLIKNQERSGDTMRRKFLSKLTQEKVWLTPSEKPKTHQTCIIYDWDDTLLCTTFLNPTN